MKKRNGKDGKFTITEVGALIEDLRSQFRVFGEGMNDLREKFDTLDAKFDTLESKVEALTGIVNHEAKKSDLSRIDIANLKSTVARIEEDIRLIKDSLPSKVDRKEFEALEKRVASITG